MKIMYENGENAVIAGEVRSLKDYPGDKFAVRIAYKAPLKDESGKWHEVEKTVDVYVRNQDAKSDGSEGIPYADRVRRMNLKAGSHVLCYVRFSDEEKKNANGYGFKYDGVLTIPNGYLVQESDSGKKRVKPASDVEKSGLMASGYKPDYNYVVKGLVTGLRKKVNAKGDEYLSLTVYTGKDRTGNFSSEMVQIKNNEHKKNAVANAIRVLSPRQDGTKIAAAFLCGAPFRTLTESSKDGSLKELAIYTAFDFTTTGQKEAARQVC